MSERPLLELIDIEAGYGRAAMVLRGLSVAVPAATVVCLVGPNGAGKSTVLEVASGMLAPRSGSIRVDGQDVTGSSPQQMLAAGLAHVLQGHNVFPEMTVAENVELGAFTVADKALIARRTAFVQVGLSRRSSPRSRAGTTSRRCTPTSTPRSPTTAPRSTSTPRSPASAGRHRGSRC